MNILPELSSVLSAIQSDVLLYQKALSECNDLYSEVFIDPEIISGKKILEDQDQCCIDEAINIVFSAENELLILQGIYNLCQSQNLNFEEELHRRNQIKNISLYDLDEDDSILFQLEYLDNEESTFCNCLENEYERIKSELHNKEFVYTCNYKGEGGEMILYHKNMPYRKFISKHNYF